ncbi:MAG TPA: hypothetical protein VJ454_01970, partial [Steroidobacteraceae bacterium]|nr:hypothetical protein [Steroidobacteraceae bacterium]
MAALLFIRFEVRAKLNGKRTKGVWTEAVAARSGKGDVDPHQTGRAQEREVVVHRGPGRERMRRDRAYWSSGDDSAREQGGHCSFRMTRRGRVPARPTNGVRTVDE